jgi:hypothetical protein
LAAGYAAALVGLTTTALMRQAGVPATQTVWAEDGRIFYSQALRLPAWQTLVKQHDGYAQLFPRLAAQVARLAPAARASEVMALLGALSLAALACLVFHMARAHVAPVLVRGLLVVAMVLLPVAGTELLDNLVNVPWWLFFASFWAMLWRPRAAPGRVAAGLLCALAAASEPLVGLLLPLGAARFVALRGARDQAPSAGLLAGLAYQAGVILTAGVGKTITPRGVPGIATSFALRAGAGLLGGTKGTNALASHHRALALVLSGLVLVVVLATGVWVVPKVRSFTLWATGLAVACFVVPVWLRGVARAMELGGVQVVSRYQAVPLLLLTSVIIIIAGQFALPGGGGALRGDPAFHGGGGAPHGRRRLAGYGRCRRSLTAATVLVVLLAPSWVADFRDANQRSAGPIWPEQVRLAAKQCTASRSSKALVAIDPPGWDAALPCRDLGKV